MHIGWCAVALVCLLLPAPVLPQVAQAPEPTVTIVGRVCVGSRVESSCGPETSPGAGLLVRAPNGLEVLTDESGLFSLSAVSGRSFALGPEDVPLTRLAHLPIEVDVGPLGPAAAAPPPIWVDLASGSTAVVEIVVRMPEPVDAPLPLSGSATGMVPAVEITELGLVYHVPLVLPPGHDALVDARPLPEREDGARLVPVLVGERQGSVAIVELAPDGRARVLRQVVLRVPRPHGGDLFSARPIEVLATLDLPPPAESVAPGALRLPVSGGPGDSIRLGPTGPVVLDEAGAAIVEFDVPRDGRLALTMVPAEEEDPVEIDIVLPVDPRAADRLLFTGDVRVGLTTAGAFGEGMLMGAGSLEVAGGTLVGGLELGDEDISRIAGGGAVLAAGRGGVIERAPDAALHGGVLGDGSSPRHLNPAGLNAWASWEGTAGTMSLGAGRTGVSEAEIGRFDRPVLGPLIDLFAGAGGLELRAHGGADLRGTGLLDTTRLRSARVELSGTGGAVYTLPHRYVAEGSERVWIETRDPRTGLVVERRLLKRGRDYELYYASGWLEMAFPVGLRGAPPAGRLGAQGLAWEHVVVVDYAHIPSPGEENDAGHGALRLSVSGGGVELGVTGAMGWGSTSTGDRIVVGDHRLGGVDLHAEPLPWLSIAASAARSSGDPFGEIASFRRSRDGGFGFVGPAPWALDVEGGGGETAPSGYATSLRLDLGGEDTGISAWWQDRAEGYADGAYPVEGAYRQAGGLGRARLLGASLSLMADHAEGVVRRHGPAEASSTVTARMERRLGPVSLAAEALHRRGRVLDQPADEAVEGDATAAGGELIFHATEQIDLSVGHLQAVSFEGSHPAGRDPTFTSAGLTLRDVSNFDVEVRGGVDRELVPSVAARWSRDRPDEGKSSYGGVILGHAASWRNEAATSVSGARSVHSSGVATFVESRLHDSSSGALFGQAIGAEAGSGPLRMLATYERGARLDDAGAGVVREGLHGEVALRLSRLTASAFAETVRGKADLLVVSTNGSPSEEASGLALRAWHAGLSARARLAEGLSIGGRLLSGRATGPAGRELLPGAAEGREAYVGAAWRPSASGPLAPTVLLHYGLRQDRLRLDQHLLVDPPRRLQLARAALVVGADPGPNLRLSITGTHLEIIGGDLVGKNSTQGVLLSRLGWPVGRLEPALEAGWRTVLGAGLPHEREPTLRAELLAVLGPARVGLGAVLAGFAGTGLEEPGLGAGSSRVYIAMRGVVQ